MALSLTARIVMAMNRHNATPFAQRDTAEWIEAQDFITWAREANQVGSYAAAELWLAKARALLEACNP